MIFKAIKCLVLSYKYYIINKFRSKNVLRMYTYMELLYSMSVRYRNM